jgi:adenylyltransferase/sulfurtransferase
MMNRMNSMDTGSGINSELSDTELLRYSRQILMPGFDIAGQLKLKQARVLVVGLGGLGSPVALYLAAAGIGHLVLVDFDVVEISNLQRQIAHGFDSIGKSKVESAAQAIGRINADCQVVAVNRPLDEKLAEELMGDADVVVDASDNFTTRFLINRYARLAKKVLVSGAAIRMEGQVTVFDFRNPDNPCYACLYQDFSEEAMTCSEAGVIAPLVGIIGSVQAMEVVKVVSGVGTPLVGRLLILDAASMEWRSIKYRRDDACTLCADSA